MITSIILSLMVSSHFIGVLDMAILKDYLSSKSYIEKSYIESNTLK
jgi:hypothetical protein